MLETPTETIDEQKPLINVVLDPEGEDEQEYKQGSVVRVRLKLQVIATSFGLPVPPMYVRAVQLDTRESRDIEIAWFSWKRRSKNDALYYAGESPPHVRRVNHVHEEPQPRTLKLTERLRYIAAFGVRVMGAKPVLSVIGVVRPEPLRDEGFRADTGFGEHTKRWTVSDGNVRGGRIVLAASTDVE